MPKKKTKRKNRPSDSDGGYIWGARGRAKARPRGYLWNHARPPKKKKSKK